MSTLCLPDVIHEIRLSLFFFLCNNIIIQTKTTRTTKQRSFGNEARNWQQQGTISSAYS